MYLYIIEIDDIEKISEHTVRTFIVTKDNKLLDIFSERDVISRNKLKRKFSRELQSLVDKLLHIMMNQHFVYKKNYLIMTTMQKLSHFQVVHQIASIENKRDYLLTF